VGNFRTFLEADLLYRVLILAGYDPFYVRNITDVDDKTIAGSQRENMALQEFTRHWEHIFHEDCRALNLLRPDCEPHAVEHMGEQISLIKTLVSQGFAYVREGSVYFDVSAWKNYGRLSRLSDRELREAAEALPEKESAEDFVLWKAHKSTDGPVFWNSPWGNGRPGWHTECSAMALKYLGSNFGIHGGGIDLCFPHHENEIAQGEAATGQPFARHWFHVAHLCINGEKMSKSIGNLYTLDDIQKMGYSPMVLRQALLAGHYRQPLNFTKESLHAAQKALERMERFGQRLRKIAGEDVRQADAFDLLDPVWQALCDDLNMPEALGKLFDHIRHCDLETLTPEQARVGLSEWQRLMFALGIRTEEEVAEVPTQIEELAKTRQIARKEKNFARADELRKALSEKGWAIEDTADGYRLSKI
jgi:cysteinyl-tRNA synthetase